jgi:CheY-like chemotaxis protein
MDNLQKKILYIDDDLDDCLLLKQAINKVAPIEIVYAHNGLEALASLQQQKQNNSLPCLIVLDINMPVMDGKETLKNIRKDPTFKSIPLVIFTTSVNSLDTENLANQNTNVLIKPSDWVSYSQIVNKLLSYL